MGVNNNSNHLHLQALTSAYSILSHISKPGFRNMESRIMGFGNWNTAHGIWNPPHDWNP